MNINELGKKYELNSTTDVWEVRKGSGKWVLTHDAVMKIADQEGITFELPQIFTEGKAVSMVGVASKGDVKTWATGEANPDNCTAKYYWAMAEKRLKDRLTLKIINAYEYGIYSEEEADEFERKQTNK